MDKSFQLYESILVSCEISCDNCTTTKTIHGIDDGDACDEFYKQGWRTRSKTYCPECAKKKLKRLD